MPMFKSIYFDPILLDPKWLQSLGGAVSNGAVILTIPAQPNGSPHILLLAAGFSDGVTSQTLTFAQPGTVTQNLVVTGTTGIGIIPPMPQFLPNTAITITLPASGVANVIGYVQVWFRIS